MGKAEGGKWRDSNFLRWELKPCFLDEKGLPLKLWKGQKHLTAGKRSECWLPINGYTSVQPSTRNPSLWDRHKCFVFPICDVFLYSWGLHHHWYKICPLLACQTVHVTYISAKLTGMHSITFIPATGNKQLFWAECNNKNNNSTTATCTGLAFCTLWLQCVFSGSENHKTRLRVPASTCQLGKLQTLALGFLPIAWALQRA